MMPVRGWGRSVALTEAAPIPHPNHRAGARHTERSLAPQRDVEWMLEKETGKRVERADAGGARTPRKDGTNQTNQVKASREEDR